MRVQCPHCAVQLNLPETAKPGMVIACGGCAGQFAVPEVTVPVAAPVDTSSSAERPTRSRRRSTARRSATRSRKKTSVRPKQPTPRDVERVTEPRKRQGNIVVVGVGVLALLLVLFLVLGGGGFNYQEMESSVVTRNNSGLTVEESDVRSELLGYSVSLPGERWEWSPLGSDHPNLQWQMDITEADKDCSVTLQVYRYPMEREDLFEGLRQMMAAGTTNGDVTFNAVEYSNPGGIPGVLVDVTQVNGGVTYACSWYFVCRGEFTYCFVSWDLKDAKYRSGHSACEMVMEKAEFRD
jgi:hypothetical protein